MLLTVDLTENKLSAGNFFHLQSIYFTFCLSLCCSFIIAEVTIGYFNIKDIYIFLL